MADALSSKFWRVGCGRGASPPLFTPPAPPNLYVENHLEQKQSISCEHRHEGLHTTWLRCKPSQHRTWRSLSFPYKDVRNSGLLSSLRGCVISSYVLTLKFNQGPFRKLFCLGFFCTRAIEQSTWSRWTFFSRFLFTRVVSQVPLVRARGVCSVRRARVRQRNESWNVSQRPERLNGERYDYTENFQTSNRR